MLWDSITGNKIWGFFKWRWKLIILVFMDIAEQEISQNTFPYLILQIQMLKKDPVNRMQLFLSQQQTGDSTSNASKSNKLISKTQ